MKNKGLHSHRLDPKAGNPREVAFAKSWEAENTRTNNADHCGIIKELIGPRFNDRDREVAATIVQWLGSNVGMCFLRDVVKSNPEIKNFINS